MEIIEGAGVYSVPADGAPNDYVPQFASADLSVGTYSIPAGGVDDQHPHREDEIYVVTAGRAVIDCDSGSAPVGPGSVIFVPAGEGHRFVSVTEDLALLVFFAPPYGSRGPRELRGLQFARGRCRWLWVAAEAAAAAEAAPHFTIRANRS